MLSPPMSESPAVPVELRVVRLSPLGVCRIGRLGPLFHTSSGFPPHAYLPFHALPTRMYSSAYYSSSSSSRYTLTHKMILMTTMTMGIPVFSTPTVSRSTAKI